MTENSPPRWIDRLLGRLLRPRLHEAVMGDLEEKYNRRLRNHYPRWAANIRYALEGLGFIRMMNVNNSTTHNPIDMYRNYLLIALRHISKDKLYVLLNISGLAIGMACVLAIFTYVKFELSYDRFHANAETIYRIPEEFIDDGTLVKSAMNHAPMAPIIAENLPGIKRVIRIFPYSMYRNAFITSTPDLKFKENNFCFGDSLFFKTFSFKSLSGSLDHALDAPFSVVITKSTAEKYFGTTRQVVGKPLTFQDDAQSYTFYVTGVIENVPQTSHFSFDFMASFSTLEQTMPWYNNWYFPSVFIYVEMEKPVDPAAITAQIQRFATEHQPDYVKEDKRKYNAQRLSDIHLHSHLDNEWEANSNYAYLQIYVVTGLFILVIACINFMNMATARSAGRAKEVGMRKVMGSNKAQLITQFLSESFIYCFASFLVAIVFAELAFRYFFNGVINKQLTLLDILAWENVLIVIGFILFISVLAGLYPSLYLSSFRPTGILKGKTNAVRGSTGLRKGLVTVQFFISCLLIAVTMIILRQVNFLKNKDLGFDEEHIISVRLSDRFAQQNYKVLKDALLAESSVVNAALCSTLPGSGDFNAFDIHPEGTEEGTKISIKTLGMDEDYISTFGLDIIQGRNFSKDIVTDQTEAFIINEAAAKKLGWENPVGKELELTVYINGAVKRAGKVIGLVRDFHFQSLHSRIEPILLYINKHPYYADFLAVKFNSGNLAASTEILNEKWKSFHPELPVDFQFMDEQLEKLYTSEMKISQIFNALAAISIFISCLGLFGLSAFMAEKKTKEVGIRKVMGASLVQIVNLQLKEFLILVVIANLLVWPFAWWWASGWLSGFAYHINVSPVVFLVTFILAGLLVALTLSYHALKAARSNPVNTLRYE